MWPANCLHQNKLGCLLKIRILGSPSGLLTQKYIIKFENHCTRPRVGEGVSAPEILEPSIVRTSYSREEQNPYGLLHSRSLLYCKPKPLEGRTYTNLQKEKSSTYSDQVHKPEPRPGGPHFIDTKTQALPSDHQTRSLASGTQTKVWDARLSRNTAFLR